MGSPVRLKDIATVTDGAENARLAAWAGDKPAVILTVQRQPGANGLRPWPIVSRKYCPSSKQPAGRPVDVDILSDRTVTIRASVADVEHELVIAIALVVLVVFIFLAQHDGHDHPGRRCPALADRHVRDHVSDRFFDQQPDPDGTDDRHRVRGG